MKTLGEDYTVEQLASRILWHDVGAGINNPCKKSALRDKYSETIGDIQAINANHPSLDQLRTLLSIINRDRLQSIGELDGKIKQLEIEKEKTLREVNTMETKCNFLKSLAEQAEEFFALSEKPEFTLEEELRLKMYRETLTQQNIVSCSDYEYLKGVIAETEEKAAPVKAHYNKCAKLLREYSDISVTYNEISQGKITSVNLLNSNRTRNLRVFDDKNVCVFLKTS